MCDGRLRVACIIANEDYGPCSCYAKLETRKDACRLDEMLRTKCGFQVIMMINATRSDMQSLANKMLLQNLRGEPDSVVLIYYAGHAVVKEGQTFLVPVDVKGDDPATYMNLNDLIRPVHDLVGGSVSNMKKAGEKAYAEPAERSCVNVFLDACRKAPPSRAQQAQWPVAPMTTSRSYHPINSDITIVYACDDGKAAFDCGYFTQALIEIATEQPGLPLADLWTHWRQRCLEKSSAKQRPWIYDSSRSMTRVLLPAEAVAAARLQEGHVRRPPELQVEPGTPEVETPVLVTRSCSGGLSPSQVLRHALKLRNHFSKVGGDRAIDLAAQYADEHPEVQQAQLRFTGPDHFVALYDCDAGEWLCFNDDGQMDSASMVQILEEEE